MNVVECSIRVTVLLEYLDLAYATRTVVGFGIITQWFVLRFFCTTARTFHDNYSSYTQIFSSLLQVFCLVGVKTNCFYIHKNRSRNFDTGWVLCHISMALNWIPFKPQKGTPTILTPST